MIINIHLMSELFCDNGLTTDRVIPLLPGVKHQECGVNNSSEAGHLVHIKLSNFLLLTSLLGHSVN